MNEQLKDATIQRVIWYINSGSRPRTVDNTQNPVKQFLKYAKENSHPQGYLSVASDGVLELKKNHVSGSFNTQIVVPSKYYFGFVLVAHCKLNHPTQSQLARRIKANHLILGLENIIKQVHDDCLLCKALSSVPSSIDTFSTTPVAKHPYRQCSADVIKRAKQCILVVTDGLTQHTSTTMIKTEKSEDILKGIVRAVLPFKPSSLQTRIKVDTAPGLSSLIKNPKKLLQQDIVLEAGRTKNKNKVAQVDRRIQELEAEIRKMSPELDLITEDTLAKATKVVNDKIRASNFSANEILFRRKHDDQQEIDIKDEEFATNIENSRKENHLPSAISKAKVKVPTKVPNISVGQLVYLKEEITKLSTRPLYVVTSITSEGLVLVKKILHFHSDRTGKYQNIEHSVKFTDLIPATSNPNRETLHSMEVLDEVKRIIKTKGHSNEKKTSPLKAVMKTILYSYDSSDDQKMRKPMSLLLKHLPLSEPVHSVMEHPQLVMMNKETPKIVWEMMTIPPLMIQKILEI